MRLTAATCQADPRCHPRANKFSPPQAASTTTTVAFLPPPDEPVFPPSARLFSKGGGYLVGRLAMGAEELRRDDMEVEDEYSDSEAFQSVGHVLQSVRMASSLVDLNDRDNYDSLVSILDSSKKNKSCDDEALLVATLKGLSEAVSKIDIMYHRALLNNAAVADQFLIECLQMLVNSFTPPASFIDQPRWLARKKEIFSQLHESLRMISDTVPLAPRMLKDVIDKSMPKLFDNKAKMVLFVECMLGLNNDMMGDLIGALLLAKVVDLLAELDVNITWEDILQEEHNKGIFDMELEDLDENEDSLGKERTKVLFGRNACAEKLDSLMVVFCEHLKSCAEHGRLRKEFDIMKTIFRVSLLRVHKSKFAQFIMFYACSLDPGICGEGFTLFLCDIFIEKEEDPISRMSAISYLGSYLSRARFISADIVVAVLKRLVEWCVAYCDLQNNMGTATKPINHQIFYAGFQVVMYVLCFRLRSIMDYPNLKSHIFNLPFGDILTHRLEPLKVCLPSIVDEFLRQAKAARLFNTSVCSEFEDVFESDSSKTIGGINRLDMFFPFDPYLLKESDRYMRPNFEYWSMPPGRKAASIHAAAAAASLLPVFSPSARRSVVRRLAMGAELRRDDMEVADEYSDSEVFQSVGHVLQSVRMAPVLDLNDKDNYDSLVSIVESKKNKRSCDDEALLVATLKGLSEAVSKIDVTYHSALLSNIFAMSIWYMYHDTRVALLELITRLAAVADQFLGQCLQMLVNNFTPPASLTQYIDKPIWLARKKEIYSQLHESLKMISDTVPLAPRMLKDIIDRSMPKLYDDKAKMVSFVECMLGLDNDRMGDLIGALLLAKVVDLLAELDVNITWEDILQEEHNKGIFDLELEDLVEDEDNLGQERTKILFAGNACAQKLDSLMVVFCEHLKSCAEHGRLRKEFDIMKTVFRVSLLRVHKSKFSQFIMFYACSLDPEICGEGFTIFLCDIFIKKEEDQISRMSAVSYLGSYLSRARFISADIVIAVLKRLVEWCVAYCDLQNNMGATTKPINHQIFYAGCQVVMYVLCFRLRSIMDYPNLKSQLFNLPFGYILTHRLEPLKVCLPSIVDEFLRQAKAARLFNASVRSEFEDVFESDSSKTFEGMNRLDTFFPFDPYLLKESDRYMRPNFEYWSMVKTTYNNYNSDVDDELAGLDAPEMNVGSLDDHVDIDFNSDDDLEYTMNKMSITPHRSFFHQMAKNSDTGLTMPARIRPSESPPS
uniref:RNA polymerase I-specific transcription initiation factor RRN3 n=1 Tax=Leersia perrieri TaxID=77586 RepID=A0A0D9WTG0_9ORYZ